MRMRSKAVLLILSGAMSVSVASAPAFAGVDAAPATADPEIVTHSATTASSDRAAEYWTAERMAAAIPVDVTLDPPFDPGSASDVTVGAPGRVAPAAPLDTSAPLDGLRTDGVETGSVATKWTGPRKTPPASTSGRVFFVGDDGGSYSCSGSTVNSDGKNVVFTAGHCVHGGGAGRAWFDPALWIFAPSYNEKKKNVTPFGYWTASQLWSLTGWVDSGDRTYDIGAVVMQTDGAGTHIVDAVGGQGIEWNWPLVQDVYQFGYPANAPFAGKKLQYCSGFTYDDFGQVGINCNMTEGASGGPWLDDFDGTFGWLDSVNSWVFWDGAGVRYKWNGPYFGDAAGDLFAAVEFL